MLFRFTPRGKIDYSESNSNFSCRRSPVSRNQWHVSSLDWVSLGQASFSELISPNLFSFAVFKFSFHLPFRSGERHYNKKQSRLEHLRSRSFNFRSDKPDIRLVLDSQNFNCLFDSYTSWNSGYDLDDKGDAEPRPLPQEKTIFC